MRSSRLNLFQMPMLKEDGPSSGGIKSQIKTLLPNFLAFGVASVAARYIRFYKKETLSTEQYIRALDKVSNMIGQLPNTQDTIFTSIKKALSNNTSLLLKKYETLLSFEEEWLSVHPEYVKVTDKIFSRFLHKFAHFFNPHVTDLGILDMGIFSIIKLFEFQEFGINIVCIHEHSDNETSFYGVMYVNTSAYKTLFFKYLEKKGNNTLALRYDYNKSEINLEPIKHVSAAGDKIYIDPQVTYIVNDLKKYIGHNVQRSYLLVGQPGTGKTCAIYQIAKQVSDRCIKISNDIVDNYSNEEFDDLLSYSNAKVIIFDDLDRNDGEVPLSKLLYYIESFKNYSNKPILLATANDINNIDIALLRPGRFDRIFDFKPYDSDIRKEYIDFLLGDNVNQEDLSILTTITKGYTNAEINEICQQYKVGIPIDVISEDMKVRMDLIGGRNKEKKKLLQDAIDNLQDLIDGQKSNGDDDDIVSMPDYTK